MKCIVGLGNIGKKYDLTRHNIGFEVIDWLLERHNFNLDKQKFRGAYTIERMGDEKVMLIEPMTLMNLSGEAVGPLMDYYGVEVEDLLVLYDDMDLEQGQIRLRQKGSAGGHNGMKSLIQHLGTNEFKRVRIGIGRPTNGMSVPDYVLQKFSSDEMKTMDKVIEHSARAVETFIETSRFDHVMNNYNGEVK
ncbi:aminoacyl-tRNA hydrolase [Staphylococcus massiliensis]|uniref:Peptidyl-tRNA hydrolase n=1 Tax=Staphylococcus massiliensis S46 TaxID=1229783 RepID=K9AFT2_9STAP|nr:aminoacyl-tRNA hydrolase [Staphylococcus massiliensis]EKU46158.1 peptidyl-tRNA hydrolase [Staphylococcus massiliensis S46]MCG3400539.1 aminoacyl-tRNA hydrolase [Staphylococcus massiliensis]MCG3402803.1 aminoacyl-tRNA hydrolase [Staphylococcus massiliensis]MCG3413200.1 aminoacyl-tRNA hydrolase [Staphylococcus massiliensis]POA01951.1 aminoacyl-tRNA hydrolase [Staphylococcus massiliensis CCUG 55927]